MTALYVILILLFFLLYLWERNKYQQINQELLYLKERIAAMPCTEENGYILIPSEHTGIRELAAELNRLLEASYLQKADYEHSRHAMNQMLTNISHDLRTPLTVLKGYSELLDKASVSPHIRDMTAKIHRKADELASMIHAYFTLSKIRSGDMRVEPRRTNLTELCHEILLDYYDILEETHFEVHIQMAPEPIYAYADPEALTRILKNLTDNAIRHGSAGNYLGIRLRKAHGRAVIEVEDHGQGIPAKDLEQIFSRNYTTARGHSGSGIGLTIAKSLALAMGAELQVSSVPDEKTIFSLLLKS